MYVKANSRVSRGSCSLRSVNTAKKITCSTNLEKAILSTVSNVSLVDGELLVSFS